MVCRIRKEEEKGGERFRFFSPTFLHLPIFGLVSRSAAIELPHLDLDVGVFERHVGAGGDGDRDLAHAGLFGRPPGVDLGPRADDESRRPAGARGGAPAAAGGGGARGGHRAATEHRAGLHRDEGEAHAEGMRALRKETRRRGVI